MEKASTVVRICGGNSASGKLQACSVMVYPPALDDSPDKEHFSQGKHLLVRKASANEGSKKGKSAEPERVSQRCSREEPLGKFAK